MLLRQSPNVPTETHELLSYVPRLQNTHIWRKPTTFFVPSCPARLPKYLLHSSWQYESFSSCLHIGYEFWGTNVASLSVHIPGYTEIKRHCAILEMFFPVPPCACLFSVCPLHLHDRGKNIISPAQLCFMLTMRLYGQHLGDKRVTETQQLRK